RLACRKLIRYGVGLAGESNKKFRIRVKKSAGRGCKIGAGTSCGFGHIASDGRTLEAPAQPVRAIAQPSNNGITFGERIGVIPFECFVLALEPIALPRFDLLALLAYCSDGHGL